MCCHDIAWFLVCHPCYQNCLMFQSPMVLKTMNPMTTNHEAWFEDHPAQFWRRLNKQKNVHELVKIDGKIDLFYITLQGEERILHNLTNTRREEYLVLRFCSGHCDKNEKQVKYRYQNNSLLVSFDHYGLKMNWSKLEDNVENIRMSQGTKVKMSISTAIGSMSVGGTRGFKRLKHCIVTRDQWRLVNFFLRWGCGTLAQQTNSQ